MILAYLTSHYARSSDTFIRAEVQGLRARGHTVHTFSIRTPEEAEIVSDEIRRERASTVYLLRDHKPAIVRSALVALLRHPERALAALALAWRTAKPGIKGHLLALVYWAEGAFLAARFRALGVQHLHNHIGEQPATVAMLAGAHAGIPFSLAIHGPYLFRAPVAWALGTKIERASFVACISDFTRSQCMIYAAEAHWPKLTIVRCGPDRRFLEGPVPPLPAAKRFVFVGRLCEEKGVPVLITAALRIARAHPEFELELVGDGPLRAASEARVRAAGMEGRIRFAGWASSDAVRAAISGARVLVLPSFAEGLPVVLMEALALGRPVISTYIAGIPELVEPGRSGWLVPAGSDAALEAVLEEAFAADDATLETLGAHGRERVRLRHDLAHEHEVLEAHLRASVGEPRRPVPLR